VILWCPSWLQVGYGDEFDGFRGSFGVLLGGLWSSVVDILGVKGCLYRSFIRGFEYG